MPSPEQLNFDYLLQPVENPIPVSKLSDVQEELTAPYTKQQEILNSTQDDPEAQAAALQELSWRNVIPVAEDYLSSKGKDLEAVARLIDALTREHGPGGLRDGLRLLRKIVSDHWEELVPKLELVTLDDVGGDESQLAEINGDDLRAKRSKWFAWLNTKDSRPYFINTVLGMPLVSTSFGDLVQLHQAEAEKSSDAEVKDKAAKIRAACRPAQLQTVHEDLTEALEEAVGVEEAFKVHYRNIVGESTGPVLKDLKEAIEACKSLIEKVQEEVGTDAPPADLTTATTEAATVADDGSVTNVVAGAGMGMPMLVASGATRDALYSHLSKIADELIKLEPHSPVPYLLQMIGRMHHMSFRRLYVHFEAIEKLLAAMRIDEEEQPSG